MLNSIKYFEENSIKIFENLETDFMKDPTKMAELVLGVTKEVHNLALKIIQDCLEDTDRLIRESVVRKNHWYVERYETKQLICSLGTVRFKKTLYTDKETGKGGVYLLDRVMDMDKHERFTEDAVAKLLEEAVQTSYRKGGEAASLEEDVSKQAVMNKIHELEFPADTEPAPEKKTVEYLYIEADEDHIPKQFNEKKGDLERTENGFKNNTIIGKLVVVHEGLEPESIIDEGGEIERKSKRWKLKTPHYFSSVSGEKDNAVFWDEIYAYITRHYDIWKVKKIYLNADGGAWITAGAKRINGLTFVLDEFHLQKYITRLTSHMLDSTDDARSEIYAAIRNDDKAEFVSITERLTAALKNPETGKKRIDESRDYILNNWTAARVRLKHEEGVIGSSTEGHVYHALSRRMSTQAMGWSVEGASKMCQLRAYYLNGGDMLELVRYQTKELPMAAGAENEYLTSGEIIRSEKNRNEEIGKYVESISHSVMPEVKKGMWYKGLMGELSW
jgi:hypothetical protein